MYMLYMLYIIHYIFYMYYIIYFIYILYNFHHYSLHTDEIRITYCNVMDHIWHKISTRDMTIAQETMFPLNGSF